MPSSLKFIGKRAVEPSHFWMIMSEMFALNTIANLMLGIQNGITVVNLDMDLMMESINTLFRVLPYKR